MRETVYNSVLAKSTLAVAARTDGTANGTGVDRVQGRDVFRTATLLVVAGAIADGTHTVELQESDNNSDFTAVAAVDLQGSEPAIGTADDNEIYEIGYVGHKRYLRASVTTSGATSGGFFGAVILLGDSSSAPVPRS